MNRFLCTALSTTSQQQAVPTAAPASTASPVERPLLRFQTSPKTRINSLPSISNNVVVHAPKPILVKNSRLCAPDLYPKNLQNAPASWYSPTQTPTLSSSSTTARRSSTTLSTARTAPSACTRFTYSSSQLPHRTCVPTFRRRQMGIGSARPSLSADNDRHRRRRRDRDRDRDSHRDNISHSSNLSTPPPPPSSSTNPNTPSTAVIAPPVQDKPPTIPAMSAVRRLLSGGGGPPQDVPAKYKGYKYVPQPCQTCASNKLAVDTNGISDPDRQKVLLRELSVRCVPDLRDRLDGCHSGEYPRFARLFEIACEVQSVVGTLRTNDAAMAHLKAERLKAMGITLFGPESTVTIITNGAGVLFIFQRDGVASLIYEGIQFDTTADEETSVDLILKAMLESSPQADTDDLQAILSSIKFYRASEEKDGIDELNSGGLDIPGIRINRADFYTTRVLCMMTNTDIYEQNFYRRYVHVDGLGNCYVGEREGETCTLVRIDVLPDAPGRPVRCGDDIIGEDLFMTRRIGRKDRFRLSCAVSVNVWEEYEAPEWFGYIHPPPNADAMRPHDLPSLKHRLESYGIAEAVEVCRLVYHCLAHKSRNSAVKVDTLSAARGYFMYLKNFLKHGTTGTRTNHIMEGDELLVVYDGLAYRVNATQTEIRHRSLFLSLLISDEKERNGKSVGKRAVIRRMASTSEVVLALCRDITYLHAEYDEEGGTMYSASAEEENIAEAWATCVALYVCDGYGVLEGGFNCAIENRRGAIVDGTAIFTNDVQVPVVFDKLFRKSSIAEEMSSSGDAVGATYPGAFISGRDQCIERTFLAGKRHKFTKCRTVSKGDDSVTVARLLPVDE